MNKGNVIPEGVLFGPYTGKFISAAEYEVIKAAKMEFGNAWEIREVKKLPKIVATFLCASSHGLCPTLIHIVYIFIFIFCGLLCKYVIL